MRIAYCISAYKDPAHLKRLINALNYDDNDVHFFIHIDKKVNIEPFQEMVTGANIHYVGRRFYVVWGGFTQVRYQVAMLEEALAFEHNREPFDRFVIITGQDYPLFSNERIIKVYQSLKDRILMTGANLSIRGTKAQQDTYRLYHFFRDLPIRNKDLSGKISKAVRMAMRILPFRKNNFITMADGEKWDIYKSSGYMSLTHEAAVLICREMRNNRRLRNFFRHSFVPEEICIPTIIFNSALKDKATLLDDDKPVWLINLSAIEQFDYGTVIKVYTEDDYGKLINSNKMFARKLESGISDRLMDLIDERRKEDTNE